MKKVLLILLFIGFTAISQAELVDDFEGYSTGQVDAVTGGYWVSNTTDNDANILADPLDASNQVMSTTEMGEQTGSYCVLNSTAYIGATETKTLFMRFMVNTLTTDQTLGLTDIDAPDVGGTTGWDQERVQWRWTNGNFDTRDSGAFVTLQALTANQWYYLWVVIDNDADTCKYYMNTTGSNATEDDLLTSGTQDTFGFRVSNTEVLDRIYWRAQNAGNEIVYVDDIHISPGESLSNPKQPGQAWSPNPKNNSTFQGSIFNTTYVQATLSWKTGLDPLDPENFDPNINNHLLYVDTDAQNLGPGNGSWKEVNIAEAGPDFNASQAFTDLDYNETYYWRVDESVNNSGPGDPETRVGSIWSFTTVYKEPKITVQPFDALRGTSETADFTVGVNSLTTPHYTWFKSSDKKAGGDSLIGGDSNTLTVVANDANDAYYYVIVSNSSTSTDTSVPVHLWLEREIARWKLDNNLTDSNMGWNTVWDAIGDVNAAGKEFVTDRIEGSHSVLLKNEPNAFISVQHAGANDYFDHYVVGLTVNCWVKCDSDVTGWDPIVAKQSRSTSTSGDHGWVLELNNGVPTFQVRNADVSAAGTTIADSTWHMITAIFDYDGWNARLYIDGELAAYDDSISRHNAVKTPLDTLTIGAEDANDGATPTQAGSFDGQIDDVRIFTYPLTGKQVAALYIDDYGDPAGKGSICVNDDNPDRDNNGDCKVDFEDFAIFAEHWLDCNLYPASRCDD